ncbi:MAG: hypothetical protein QNJ75_13645 [Acidimicrobiia bacterium]|nr:hypothetical protein [Acidimicrobiia bacterium]
MTVTANRGVQASATDIPAGFGRRGAAAGAMATVVFTVVHHLTISNIWAPLPIMLGAGGLCGWSLAWSYERLFDGYSLRTWLGYNAAHLAVFAALGVASIVVFESVTTVAAVMARGGPVDDLIARALPMTVTFIVLATVAMGIALGRGWRDYLRLAATIGLLMLFLGSNISVLGLVDFGGAPLGPLVTFLALTFLLAAVYAVAFSVLATSARL